MTKRVRKPNASVVDSDVVVGIDPSSKKLALVMWYEDVVEAKIYLLGSRSGPDACGLAMSGMNQYLQRVGDGHWAVFVESPLVGRAGIKSTLVQANIGGVIQACCAVAGVPVYMVHPSTWKAAVCNSPHASKDDVRDSVRRRWPEAFRACDGDSDLMDAAGICLYGRQTIERSQALA